MSVITSRKSLNSSILKTSASRSDSIRKTKVLRFDVDIKSVKDILKELDDNPTSQGYQNLIFKISESGLEVSSVIKCSNIIWISRSSHLLFRMKNCVISFRKR